jgi:uncharacterized membrane protein YdbT with pleckstrin-like domain
VRSAARRLKERAARARVRAVNTQITAPARIAKLTSVAVETASAREKGRIRESSAAESAAIT